jgi:anti-sigma factor RsiW
MTARDYTERDIHMSLDGELPAEEAADFQAWLAVNPEMKARSSRFEADRAGLRRALAGVLDEPLPERFARIVSGERVPARRAVLWRSAAAAAAIFAVGALGGYLAGVGDLGLGASADDRIAEQAIAAHTVYSAEQRHAVEVGADDRDHLLGWLSKRTGVTLIAPDLAAQGFELVGGRLLPSGGKPAAMLLYEDAGKNRISVYVTGDGEAKARGTYADADGGPSAIYWLDEGYACAVVGTLPKERLADVARSAWRQLAAGAGIG